MMFTAGPFALLKPFYKVGNSSCQRKRGRPSNEHVPEQPPAKKRKQKCDLRPITDVQHDGTGQWPEIGAVQQRCKNPGCEMRSKFYCTKCTKYTYV